MATAKVIFPDELAAKIAKLAERTDEISEKALKAGGEVVLGAAKRNLAAVIGKTKYSRSTGELLSSLGLSPMKIDRDGNPNVRVGFNEPRRKQTAAKGKRSYHVATNAMIANVIEYGRHGKQSPKPFMKPAQSSSKSTCKAAMIAAFEREIGNL